MRYFVVVVICLVALNVPLVHPGAADSNGADLTTDQPTYTYYGNLPRSPSIQIEFKNTGQNPLYFGNTAPFYINDSTGTVFSPGSIAEIVEIPPGSTYRETWNLATNCLTAVAMDPSCAGFALPGEYTVFWDYSTSISFTSFSTITTTFRISGA